MQQAEENRDELMCIQNILGDNLRMSLLEPNEVQTIFGKENEWRAVLARVQVQQETKAHRLKPRQSVNADRVKVVIPRQKQSPIPKCHYRNSCGKPCAFVERTQQYHSLCPLQ